MNSYEEYLEKRLELREKEIDMYKDFIENELGVRIRESIESEARPCREGVENVRFKVITIPQKQYVLHLS